MKKKIKSVLISVYEKSGLDDMLELFKEYGTMIYSTGGTWDYLKQKGFNPVKVEDLTQFPSMLDGRVKTLHPAVFAGILARRENDHLQQLEKMGFPEIDMVIVDLYPFENTIANTDDEEEIIEKIDIGGVSLIRAAAKNHSDVVVVGSKEQYQYAAETLRTNSMYTDPEERKKFAKMAFAVTMHYDTIIYRYLSGDAFPVITRKVLNKNELRYGENSHQKGFFYGNMEEAFIKLNGKELSYNNLVDIDAAIALINDIPAEEPTFAILKHTNPCGVATRPSVTEAWESALECDPLSAFGGIIICNTIINMTTAKKINEIFYEVLLAPDFGEAVVEFLSKKKNRVILRTKKSEQEKHTYKKILSGILVQETDLSDIENEKFDVATLATPSEREKKDLLYANAIVKHLKSNAIALVKNKQLAGMGCGQTSRVDATRQSIEKALRLGIDIEGAVLASDAFFPFPDSIELAYAEGIRSIIQPGGSVNDHITIKYCDENGIAMVMTGVRHFKH